jgi:hypothetical protein
MCSYNSGWPSTLAKALVLQIVAAGVGGAAQQKCALARVLQIRLHRVKAHERRKRDGVRAVALKRLFGVLLGSGANVAALGVQDDRHVRRVGAQVLHQAL